MNHELYEEKLAQPLTSHNRLAEAPGNVLREVARVSSVHRGPEEAVGVPARADQQCRPNAGLVRYAEQENVAEKEERQVCLLTTGNKHSRFTVMLCSTADSHKLPPFVVFKWKTLPKETFPPSGMARVNKKGFFNEDTVLE